MRAAYDACPLCESDKLTPRALADCTHHPLYSAELPPEIMWDRCEECGHVFTHHRWTQEGLRVLFRKVNECQQVGYGLEANRQISARIVERIDWAADAGNWLDVGFGNGSLLFTAAEFGFTPVGLDLRGENVETIQKLGVEAYCIDIEGYALETPKKSCSVVSMCDVLEHIAYPRGALHAAWELLQPGGVLFLSMPHYDSIAWRLLDAAMINPYWGEIEHHHNFSRERLYALLKECWFEPYCYSVSERYRLGMEVCARRVA